MKLEPIDSPTIEEALEMITPIVKTKERKNRRAYMRAYREANKEKIKAYYEANKEKIKAYYEANKEKIKAYREANREKKNDV